MTNSEWLNQLPNNKMCSFLEHENFAPYHEDGYPNCTACSIPHDLADKERNCSKCITNWLKAEHAITISNHEVFMTNGEWLRQLNNEDLADFWANVSGAFCCQYENGERVCENKSSMSCAWCMLKWLNSEKELKLPEGDFERLQDMVK